MPRLALPRCEMGDDEIRAEAHFNAVELGVVLVQRTWQDRDRVRVPEAGERVTTPAGEVHRVEREVRDHRSRVRRLLVASEWRR